MKAYYKPVAALLLEREKFWDKGVQQDGGGFYEH